MIFNFILSSGGLDDIMTEPACTIWMLNTKVNRKCSDDPVHQQIVSAKNLTLKLVDEC